jgi:WD40 repeat protein
VRICDASSGRKEPTFKGFSGSALGLAFIDGRRLAAASGDGMVKIWDLTTGQELLSSKGPVDQPRSVAISPDGARLASTAGDGAVKIWDATTSQEIFSLPGHNRGP